MKMKKKMFAGVLTMMLLLASMSMTVFADESPNSEAALQKKTDELNRSTSVDQNAYNSNNEVIKVTANKISKETYSNANAVAKGQDAGAEVLAMSDLSVPSGTNTSKGIKVTIKAPGIRYGDNVYVLHQKSSGSWEVLKPNSVSNGQVTVTLYSFSPVAVVKYSSGVTPNITTDPSRDENSGSSNGSTVNNNTSNSSQSNSQSNSNSQNNPQTNSNNPNNSQSNNQNNPVNVNQNVTVKYPESDQNEDDDYDDGYNDGYSAGKRAANRAANRTAASATTTSVKGSGSQSAVSPKTGNTVPAALPVVAVIACAGVIVCGRKAQKR